MSAHIAVRQGAWLTLLATAGFLIALAGPEVALSQAWPTRDHHGDRTVCCGQRE
jgi:hypothetical protein